MAFAPAKIIGDTSFCELIVTIPFICFSIIGSQANPIKESISKIDGLVWIAGGKSIRR